MERLNTNYVEMANYLLKSDRCGMERLLSKLLDF